MYGDHPPSFGAQHPWNDPLAPQDVFDPLPATELGMAGGLAPDPQTFPYTPEGRRDYHAAVRAAAHQQQQMMQMAHMQAASVAQGAQEAAAREAHKRTWFLLSA